MLNRIQIDKKLTKSIYKMKKKRLLEKQAIAISITVLTNKSPTQY
jgi:hypothetical protein